MHDEASSNGSLTFAHHHGIPIRTPQPGTIRFPLVFPLPVIPGWNQDPWAFPRASHPTVTRSARRGGNRPCALARVLPLRHQPNLHIRLSHSTQATSCRTQPLHPVRRRVPGVFRDRPLVLARQITHQRGDVPGGLRKRLHPTETRLQPPRQPGQIRHRPLALYDDNRNRLIDLMRHNMIIPRRLPS